MSEPMATGLDLSARETAFERTPAALLVTDLRGRVEEANPAARRLLDADRVEEAALGRALDRAVSGPVEVDGVRGWVELVGGRAVWTLDPRPQEEAGTRLFDTVLLQLPVGVVIAEAPSGRIVRMNERAAQILGGPVPPATSTDAYADYPYAHSDGTPVAPGETPLGRALAGETVRGCVGRWSRPDGSPIVIESSAAPVLDAEGRIVAAVTVFADVTARARAEHAEREFVTNAAHELQTPLAAIVGAVEVLVAGAKDDPVARERFLGHVARETDRLIRLVQALLLLARAQHGGERPALEDVPLRPLLDELAVGLEPAPGIEVRVRCPAPLAARANRGLLEQALAGVAANAAKFTTAGSIRLEARRLEPGRVAIDVLDTGPGIEPGDEDAALARFYRGQGRRDADGFGLGLAIARQAVEALDGTIELGRRPGGGAAVRLTLPEAP